MPDLVLLVTDRHTTDALVALLPHGCVYVGVTLTASEWAAVDSDVSASTIVRPMLREAIRRWPEVRS